MVLIHCLPSFTDTLSVWIYQLIWLQQSVNAITAKLEQARVENYDIRELCLIDVWE